MNHLPRSYKRSAIPHILRLLNAKHIARQRNFRSIYRATSTPLQLPPKRRFQDGIQTTHRRTATTAVKKSPSQLQSSTNAAVKIPGETARIVSSPRVVRARPSTYEEDAAAVEAARLKRRRERMFVVTCTFAAIISCYVMYLERSYDLAVAAASKIDLPQNADVSDRWRDLSRDYDDEVDFSEKFMFMPAKRKRLVNEASGNVLEVSVGTGRNMEYYDLRPFDPAENAMTGRSRSRIVRALTFNDQSEVMVAQAEKKFEEMEKKRKPDERFTGHVEYVIGDAGINGVIKRPEGGFDTIVQTMGICSMVDPVGFLKRLGNLCRQPGEKSRWSAEEENDGKGGKILLLEHGRGYFNPLNNFLDGGAKMHAIHYGCWWNKDIGKVVEESGLVVERIRRYHWGTTWEIVLRPVSTEKLS